MLDADVILLGIVIAGGKEALVKAPAKVASAEVQAVLDLLREGKVEQAKLALGLDGKSLAEGIVLKSQKILAHRELNRLRYQLTLLNVHQERNQKDSAWKVKRIREVTEEMEKWSKLL